MDRRGFFQFVASLPFVGQFIPIEQCKKLPDDWTPPAEGVFCEACEAMDQPTSFTVTIWNGETK